jgi:hypothetical protein
MIYSFLIYPIPAVYTYSSCVVGMGAAFLVGLYIGKSQAVVINPPPEPTSSLPPEPLRRFRFKVASKFGPRLYTADRVIVQRDGQMRIYLDAQVIAGYGVGKWNAFELLEEVKSESIAQDQQAEKS